MGKAEELWGSGGKSSWACSAPGEMVPPIGGDGIRQLPLGIWRDIRSEEGWTRNIHIGLELARVDLEGRGMAGEGWVFAGLEGVDEEVKWNAGQMGILAEVEAHFVASMNGAWILVEVHATSEGGWLVIWGGAMAFLFGPGEPTSE